MWLGQEADENFNESQIQLSGLWDSFHHFDWSLVISLGFGLCQSKLGENAKLSQLED